jgi:recombination protein RecR
MKRIRAQGVFIHTGLPFSDPQASGALSSPFEELQKQLKELPGLGYRSAERIALHLLVEHPEKLPGLVAALGAASQALRRCPRCGNLAEGGLCGVCADPRRSHRLVCVVERVPDLVALERSGAWSGVYHVLHGRLSPMHGVGPDDLNFAPLFARIAAGEVDEVILSLANDVEGEATCHYITSFRPEAPSRSPASDSACRVAPAFFTRTPSRSRAPSTAAAATDEPGAGLTVPSGWFAVGLLSNTRA